MVWRWFAALVLVLPLTQAHAERRLHLGSSRQVLVRLMPPKPTAIIFPEPIANTVTEVTLHEKGQGQSAPGAEDPYGADFKGAMLFLLPKDPALNTRLFVIVKSGDLYKVELTIGQPADDIVHLSTGMPGTKASAFDVPSMLRLLITGGTVPTQQESTLAMPTLQDTRLVLVDASGIMVGGLHGFVVTIRNTHEQPVRLDERLDVADAQRGGQDISLRTLIWPPRTLLKALSVETHLLQPGAQGRVFAVLEKR